MNLYDLTVAAEQDVSTYRSADIEEWRAAIDPVLKAAGEHVVGKDSVDDIALTDTELRIIASYSVRCCDQTRYMRLPIYIVMAENPVRAATHYRVGKELSEAKSRLAAAQRAVTECSAKVSALEVELAASA